MSKIARVSIVGASGYGGGELLRLLMQHPHVEIAQVTSESNAGNYVHSVHPNLRPAAGSGRQPLRFTSAAELAPCDVLFLALPHGEAQRRIQHFADMAERIVDLSADFRLADAALYERRYGEPHASPDWLGRFAYGLPEINREAIRQSRYCSGVGCNATASILALLPFMRSSLLRDDLPIIVDIKAGSSEGGASPSLASHHPERSGAVRSFAPTGHRHEAEVVQALGREDIYLSVTSIELVRGVLATAHLFAKAGVEVIEARISHLAYAQEIASAMLQRQQASAIVAARQTIVEGAVGMVEMALDALSEKNIVALDDERKAAMVSNLLVVLCSDRAAQPVVNTGTLYT